MIVVFIFQIVQLIKIHIIYGKDSGTNLGVHKGFDVSVWP